MIPEDLDFLKFFQVKENFLIILIDMGQNHLTKSLI